MAIKELWVEKYRPKTTDEYVFRDESQKSQVESWIKDKSIPHLLFSGSAGVGKTALAKILINELDIEPYDVLEINASRENSVDTIRDKITGFVQTMPFGDFKVVLLDECLDENTLVIVKRNSNEESVKIKDLDDNNDLVKSFNIETNTVQWKSFKLFDKGVQDVYEVILDTGDKFVCTEDHKWYVGDPSNPSVVKTTELSEYNHILSPYSENSTSMKQIKIKSIKKLDKQSKVYDLSVNDNHNFFIRNVYEILTHNCDFVTTNGQAVLRGVMERYHSTARFILTCNYPHKILPALHSRCQGFHIEKVDQTEFTARVAEILLAEKINFDIDTLDTYVKSTYPDLRKCLNTAQMNSSSGVLEKPHGDEGTDSSEYKIKVVDLFKQKKFSKGRQLLCASVRRDEMEGLYRWFYDNLDLWGDTNEQQDQAILIIKNGLVNHTLCSDSEINLSATIIELTQLKE